MSGELDVQITLETPTGWVALEDEANGYWLHKDTLGTRSTTHRKTEISNEYVAGTFVVRAVKENVTETIAVWVRGATPYQLRQRVKVITDGFDQLNYTAIVRVSDSQDTWVCQLADYVMETSQEFQVATLALVRATVPRLPQVATAQVVPV